MPWNRGSNYSGRSLKAFRETERKLDEALECCLALNHPQATINPFASCAAPNHPAVYGRPGKRATGRFFGLLAAITAKPPGRIPSFAVF
jgi:hypothetical protein